MRTNVSLKTLQNSAFSHSKETAQRFSDQSFPSSVETMAGAEETKGNVLPLAYALQVTLSVRITPALKGPTSSVSAANCQAAKELCLTAPS